MAYETIILDKKERIATITLNRPPMNPLNRKMYEELGQVAAKSRPHRQHRHPFTPHIVAECSVNVSVGVVASS